MRRDALQRPMAWAEDRATQRCDPSADPGAKTGAGIGPSGLIPLSPSQPLRTWHQRAKPWRHDAATIPAGCPFLLANANRSKFQFTVNQDTARGQRLPLSLAAVK